MPLETAKEGTPGFGRNVATEIKAGKPEKQAVAIAYEKARGDGDLGNRPEWFKGQTAGRQGKPLSANPYSGSAAKAWASGHKRGKEAMGDGVSAREERGRSTVTEKPKEESKYKPAYLTKEERAERKAAGMKDTSIDAVFAAADAMFSRADAMETGRWDMAAADEWSEEARKAAAEARKKGGSSEESGGSIGVGSKVKVPLSVAKQMMGGRPNAAKLAKGIAEKTYTVSKVGGAGASLEGLQGYSVHLSSLSKA